MTTKSATKKNTKLDNLKPLHAPKTEYEKAQEIIKETEKKEVEAIGVEVNAFLKSLNDRGYDLQSKGSFFGKDFSTNLVVVKTK